MANIVSESQGEKNEHKLSVAIRQLCRVPKSVLLLSTQPMNLWFDGADFKLRQKKPIASVTGWGAEISVVPQTSIGFRG